MATSTQARSDVSIGELVSRVVTDLSTLVRQELALAKAEVKQEVAQVAKGGAMFGVAALAGLLTLVFLSFALLFGLAEAGLALWTSALIVGLVWAVIGGITALLGRNSLKKIDKPERTIRTVKEDVQWLKTRAR